MRRLLFALLLLAWRAGAEEYPELNFAVEWPAGEGWGAPKDQPVAGAGGLRRDAKNRALRQGFQASVMPPGGATLDGDGFVRDLIKGMATNVPGARVASERRHEVAGVPALTLEILAEHEGEVIRVTHLAVIADDRLYGITALSVGGDHAWAEGAVRTFRFLKPPAPPPGTAWHVSYAIGQYVIGPLLLVGLVLGLAWLARRLLGRRSS